MPNLAELPSDERRAIYHGERLTCFKHLDDVMEVTTITRSTEGMRWTTLDVVVACPKCGDRNAVPPVSDPYATSRTAMIETPPLGTSIGAALTKASQSAIRLATSAAIARNLLVLRQQS